ncbi:exocyst complex component 3-like [Anoplopoma fimbria]|uniref:exocyst complex component 3-like n=1 Tax=Anoplopoma fimbria TaxID=229290 RepID=UPI0023EACEF9|nr:exocyst complex component 3-like [Anoplopoma fimbria]
MTQCEDRGSVKPFQLRMKKMRGFRGLSRSWRTDSRRPLIENDIQEDQASSSYDNLTHTSNNNEERRRQSEEQITLQELVELLGMAPESLTSEDGSLGSTRPAEQQIVVRLIQTFVNQHFPKPPATVDQNLYQYLFNVQTTVKKELVRLGPRLQSEGLIECYHRQTFDHLDDLLQIISSPENSFVLMQWVLHTYLSKDLLGHPDLQYMDPIKNIDLLLLTEWVSRAREKLLENVQKEIKQRLERILQIERRNNADDELYVDTIQCIEAMPKELLKISPKLSDEVLEICCKELLIFLTRYTAEQRDILVEKARMDEPETEHFFKTLKNCKNLKEHVQTKAKDLGTSPLKEIMTEAEAKLEDMEAFTLKLLREIVSDIAESHLKKYFKSDNTEFILLIHEVKNLFFKLSSYQDVQKRVMDEAYKLIAHIYLKRLIQIRQSKLRKYWHDVKQTLAEDALLLHNNISDLAPGVDQWNLMLLKVKELLECKDLDATKMTAAKMYEECRAWSEDLELLPAILQWKGLSGSQIREVQFALEDIPGFQPRPRTSSGFSCFTRWLICCPRGSSTTIIEDRADVNSQIYVVIS